MPELRLQDSIIATRQRRQNAGNRLQALLNSEAPLDSNDDIFSEVADDQDFELTTHKRQRSNDNDEEESEDGEAADNFSSSESDNDDDDDNDEAQGEKEIRDQERIAQRKKKTKIDIIMSKAQRSKITPKPIVKRPKRDITASLLNENRRSSSRSSTVQNKNEVLERLQSRNMSSNLRKSKIATPLPQKKLTQEERLKIAKETELENTKSLNNFLSQEHRKMEERRAMSRKKREMEGPFIRFISKTIEVPGAPSGPTSLEQMEKDFLNFGESENATATSANGELPSQKKDLVRVTVFPSTSDLDIATLLFGAQSKGIPTAVQGPTSTTTHTPSSDRKAAQILGSSLFGNQKVSSTVLTSLGATSKASSVTTGKSKFTSSTKSSGAPLMPATAATPTGASAAATLAAARIPKCVVSGKPCKFVDPRTGVPYESMEGFQIIRSVLAGNMSWNGEFGVFIGGSRSAKGVPEGFE